MRRRSSWAALLALSGFGGFSGFGSMNALGKSPAPRGESQSLPPAAPAAVYPGRPMRFPEDHGAHPNARIEWWYLTGHLQGAAGPRRPRWGFQLTFFRFKTGLAESLPGLWAPRHLLFAHAALTDLSAAEPALAFRHAQRLGRWNGSALVPTAHASLLDTDLALGGWRLLREPRSGSYRAEFELAPGAAALHVVPSQPLLLQGDAGYSRKGPSAMHASQYYSQPQLRVAGSLTGVGGEVQVEGGAWLDHEWSDSLLPAEAEGWDWAGLNLDDGSALTVFRLRRSGGAGAVWAGGSFRTPGGATRSFEPGEVEWRPGRLWRSPQTGANYPVEWTLTTPQGRFGLRALLDAQELDSRMSTGTVYWEGLSELLNAEGRRVGLGYLEMTGYSGRLKL